jgi:hypothetical protein
MSKCVTRGRRKERVPFRSPSFFVTFGTMRFEPITVTESRSSDITSWRIECGEKDKLKTQTEKLCLYL